MPRQVSSFIRFAAKLPNETWQADATPWTLADGSPVEILNFLDDCSRVALASSCFRTVKGHDVAHVFQAASNTFGLPASLLTDNGAVFTGRQRRGKVILELELELERLGIVPKHSTAYHPQTCGKVERFHQTLKRFLRKQRPARSLADLQHQLDLFRAYYNNLRRPFSLEVAFYSFNGDVDMVRRSAGPANDHIAPPRTPLLAFCLGIDRDERHPIDLCDHAALWHPALVRTFSHRHGFSGAN